MKYIIGLAGEPDLIDKFGCHQVSNRRFDTERSQQVQGRSWSIISDDKELDVLGAPSRPVLLARGDQDDRVRCASDGQDCIHQLPPTEFQKGLDLVASGKESVKVSLIPA